MDAPDAQPEDPMNASATTETEVTFPEVDGRRGSTPVTRSVLADAVAVVDPALAAEITRCSSWRKDYVDLVHRATAASAGPAGHAVAIARAGLESMRSQMVLAGPQGDVPIADAGLGSPPVLHTETVDGAARAVPELRVPYRGRELAGDTLLVQVDRWVDSGLAEPGFRDAIEAVVEHPEWLAVPGRRLALLGAGAEMSPLGPLTAWGADVLAVDVPVPAVSERLHRLAREGAGTTRYPLAPNGVAGADLVRHTAALLEWLRRSSEGLPTVLGMYAYADGGAHVQVTAAFDLIATALLDDDPATALAYLATPTDAFLVGTDVVAHSRRAWASRGLVRHLQAPLRAASRGALFAPHYPEDADAVADVLVPQQGPSYAMAKRLQRWRGVASEAQGRRVSFNVAPATLTRSVTKNRLLAAAYAGAPRFGVEIFAPDTSRTLMAALLVHDLHRDAVTRAHPEELFSDTAAHGGLWRVGYEPRSVLGIAAVGGMPSAILGR
ncbi:hypothetical protein [Mumia flava]|uniref:hypothetical protein n=1 Tax=Mumia flava TaxID=1348852 RepID=UPI001B80BC69|nr:hypothetical protein [Mumia flava]